VAAVDVGCNVTNLVVSSPQSLWFRSCGVAGHSFTRALVKEFKLSMAQAEQRKRSPELSERFSDLYEAMSPVFEDLLKELRQSLAAYAVTHPIDPFNAFWELAAVSCCTACFDAYGVGGRLCRCGGSFDSVMLPANVSNGTDRVARRAAWLRLPRLQRLRNPTANLARAHAGRRGPRIP